MSKIHIEIVRPGTLITSNEVNVEKYAVPDGFITVKDNETIESKEEIVLSRTEATKDRTDKRLFGKKKDSIDFTHSGIALHRAIDRISTLG